MLMIIFIEGRHVVTGQFSTSQSSTLLTVHSKANNVSKAQFSILHIAYLFKRQMVCKSIAKQRVFFVDKK